MSTKYFALLTQLGADKLANAAALGTKIEITHMAVGDGGGSLPTPDTKQTKLINEKRRAAINTLSIDPKNTNQIVAEQVIPENEGGWWIREIGLFDKDGILIAVGNCAETYKPQLQEGSGRTQTIRMILIVSSADSVTLKVDPSVILATREYVDDSINKHANSRNHPDATLNEKGFVILSSAVDSNSETHAATPKAVKAAYDLAKAAENNAKAANENANTRLEKNKNGADVADKGAFNRNIGSGRAFSGEVSIGGAGTWTTEEFIAWLKSKGAFNHPYWMCKSTWAYANNRMITDTGCGSIHLAGAVVEVMGIESVMTIRVTTAPTSVNGCIPNAQFTYGNHGKDYLPSWRRDYNTANKPTAGEVGAYSKDETDARVNAANENANSRLEKNKNGADIPNKDEFVKNLGLTDTVRTGRKINGKPLTQDVVISSQDVFSQIELLNKIDLNNITQPGIYVQTSSIAEERGENYPSTLAGTLIVYRSVGVIQEFIEYGIGTKYQRAFHPSYNLWSMWEEVLTVSSSKIKQTRRDGMAALILNGMLIQAGSVFAPAGTTARYSLPSAFKTFAYVVGGVGVGSGSSVNAGVSLVGLNQIEVSRAVNSDVIRFIAVGDY
ncbi:phage tail protein [Xenorhabdus sp. SGI240]|uniref:phage tail-collar fiber domain-containing protein n=1 Tax=Xenorhabdus sp. SGI240 TaxID=3158262 RepID=UPI0032B83D2A